MLIYVLLIIIILMVILIIFKNQKNSALEPRPSTKYQLKNNHVSSSININTTKVKQPDYHQTKETETALNIQQKISALMNDRNFFAAEAQINEALKSNNSSHELYFLLSDIYLLQKDEFAINQLYNRLRASNLDEVLSKIKAKIRDNNLQEIQSIDFVPIPPTTKNSTTPLYQSQQNPQVHPLPELSQTDKIALIFERAERYIRLGNYDEAKKLITEFEENYNDEQRNQADQLLKKIAS